MDLFFQSSAVKELLVGLPDNAARTYAIIGWHWSLKVCGLPPRSGDVLSNDADWLDTPDGEVIFLRSLAGYLLSLYGSLNTLYFRAQPCAS